jgi:type I restriction enzyme S subunit
MQFIESLTIEEVTEKIIDYRGKTPPKTKAGIKLITAKIIKDGYILDENHEYISEETYKSWMTRGFPKNGDILITTEAPLGEVAQLKTSEKVALAQRVILLRGKPNLIDQEYYLYALKTPFVQRQLYERAASTTVLGIKSSELQQVRIPLPPLAEQKWIASIAQKADRLRRSRRYALQLSDTYLRSVFLEMFGAQQPSYERMTLSEVCLKVFDCKHYTPPYVPEGIPLIKTNDVVPGFFQFGNTVYVSLEEYEKLTDVNKPEQGDIVFAREGSFGVASYIADNRKYAIGQRMMLLRADKRKVNPIYLTHFINSPPTKENLLKVSMGTTVQRVNVGDVKNLPVSIPPLPLQEKFAQIVQKFDRLRTQQREAERQAEHLFQTILHRAFRGELTSQNADDEPESVLLEEIRAQQAKAEAEAKAATQAMGDAADYVGTKAKQQDLEPIQLKFPGFE